jgi:hypothetical protein
MVKSRNQKRDLDDLSSITHTGKADEIIFKEGDDASVMFVIEEGEIELTKMYGGEKKQLGRLGSGDFFGEMSLLEEQPREAAARSITDYKIVEIDASTFDQLIQENPEIAVRMLRKLSRRLMEVHEAEARAQEIARGALGPAEEKRPKKPKAAVKKKKSGKPFLFYEPTSDQFEIRTKGVTTIGRYDRSAEYTPDVDFTSLNTDTVSRRHARILKRDDGFYLQEEIARNGTFVNGKKVRKGKMVRLRDGDSVAFGTLTTVFRSP